MRENSVGCPDSRNRSARRYSECRSSDGGRMVMHARTQPGVPHFPHPETPCAAKTGRRCIRSGRSPMAGRILPRLAGVLPALPADTGARVTIVHKVGAMAVAAVIGLFGVLGLAGGLDYFSTDG